MNESNSFPKHRVSRNSLTLKLHQFPAARLDARLIRSRYAREPISARSLRVSRGIFLLGGLRLVDGC
eukprot:7445442-Pyramimonas_sp.AAC.1